LTKAFSVSAKIASFETGKRDASDMDAARMFPVGSGEPWRSMMPTASDNYLLHCALRGIGGHNVNRKFIL
jgi:hypothetical protein